MLGNIKTFNALKVNWLKNYHPIRILLPSAYPAKFYRQDSNKSPPNFPGRYVVALGWHIYEFFSPCLPLTILCFFSYKCSPGFW